MRRRKKFLFMITVAIICMLPITVLAAGNSMSTATGVSFKTTYKGSITDNNTIDYYKIVLPSSGEIDLSIMVSIRVLGCYLYDNQGHQMWYRSPGANDSTGIGNLNATFHLTKGIYYFAASEQGSPSSRGDYSFQITFTSANESFTETNSYTNNSMDSASVILLGKEYKGQIAENDSRDFYQFTMNEAGKLSLSAKAKMLAGYYLYDTKGNLLWNKAIGCDNLTGVGALDETIALGKGTYYFVLTEYGSPSSRGNYSFTLNIPSALSVSDAEVSLAYTNVSYDGNAKNPVPTVKLKGRVLTEGTDYRVSYKNNIKAGTATVTITGINDYTGTRSKTFAIKQVSIANAYVTLSKSAVIYNGKLRKPSVLVKLNGKKLTKGGDYTVIYKNNRKVGTAVVLIKGKGNYTGTYTTTFTINPKKTAVKKLVNKARGTMTVKWKKVSGVTGYEIQYSSSSSFSYNVKRIRTTGGSKVIRKLTRGMTYFVRIRSYKRVKGVNYYSSWSQVKHVYIW